MLYASAAGRKRVNDRRVEGWLLSVKFGGSHAPLRTRREGTVADEMLIKPLS